MSALNVQRLSDRGIQIHDFVKDSIIDAVINNINLKFIYMAGAEIQIRSAKYRCINIMQKMECC